MLLPLDTETIIMKGIGRGSMRVVDYEPLSLPVMVLQGTGDATVDCKCNMKFIKMKFPKANII